MEPLQNLKKKENCCKAFLIKISLSTFFMNSHDLMGSKRQHLCKYQGGMGAFFTQVPKVL